jgi:hypothetical protein
MYTTHKQLLALALTAIMVFSTGCFGWWGFDDPTTGQDESDEPDSPDADETDSDAPDSEADAQNGDNDAHADEGGDDPPPSSTGDGFSDTPGAVESPDDERGTGDGSGDRNGSGSGDTSPANGNGDSDGAMSSSTGDGNGDAPPSNGNDNGDGDGDTDSDANGNGDDSDEEETYTLTVEASEPVTLERNWEDASTTREPTDGVVEFSVVAGEYTLVAEEYEDEVVEVDGDMTVTMTPISDFYELTATVQVVDGDGEPIEGELVEKSDPDIEEWEPVGETDSNGEVTLVGGSSEADDAIQKQVRVSDEIQPVHLTQEGTHTVITLGAADNGDEETYTLTVTVIEDGTGTPISGASVAGYLVTWPEYSHGADQFSETTDSDGVATADGLYGSYDVDVEASGYERTTLTLKRPATNVQR